MADNKNKQRPSFWVMAGRGITGKCPMCGKGALFSRYLKQVEHCEKCGEEFGHIRADDGPAWLTILFVGHVFAFILSFAPETNWQVWQLIAAWCSAALALSLITLPRAKGLFIGIIWRMGCSGSEK
jgi:uncharacterized protein (DUF983 family)